MLMPSVRRSSRYARRRSSSVMLSCVAALGLIWVILLVSPMMSSLGEAVLDLGDFLLVEAKLCHAYQAFHLRISAQHGVLHGMEGAEDLAGDDALRHGNVELFNGHVGEQGRHHHQMIERADHRLTASGAASCPSSATQMHRLQTRVTSMPSFHAAPLIR